MKAMVYTAPGELEICDVDEPKPLEDEVLVRVEGVGICGSELEGFASRSPFRVPPLIMGHEFVGRRTDNDERVVVNPVVSCGSCDLCRRGLENVCRRRLIIGIQRPGAFGELVAVPERNCHAFPDNAEVAAGALVEPLANAFHALGLVQSHDPVPTRVGVIGAGPLGFLVALTARDRGIPEVVVADRAPERRRLANASGASAIVDELDGEFDAVFDAVGSSSTRQASIALLRPGGTALWMGLHEADPGFDALSCIRFERRVLSSFCYRDHEYRAAAIRAASLRPTWARLRPLAEGRDAFLGLVGGDVSAIKTVLVPNV